MDQHCLKLGEMIRFNMTEPQVKKNLIDKCILTEAGEYLLIGNIVSEYYYNLNIMNENLRSTYLVEPINKIFIAVANHEVFVELDEACMLNSYNLSIVRLE